MAANSIYINNSNQGGFLPYTDGKTCLRTDGFTPTSVLLLYLILHLVQEPVELFHGESEVLLELVVVLA